MRKTETNLSRTKRGIAVECQVCGVIKAPIGRALPAGLYRCQPSECEGYDEPPFPGSLWPGESEAEFGYPVGVVGTKEELRDAKNGD